MDYLKYWAPVMLVSATGAGLIAGGGWVWAGIASLPALALLDILVGPDFSTRSMGNALLASIPVWLCALGPLSLYFILAWSVTAHDLNGWQVFGAVLSVAWMSVVPLGSACHELYHMRSVVPRFVGRYVQLCFIDSSRDIGHVINHHIDVATDKDIDTARRGETLFSFTGQSLIESTVYALRKEAQALRRSGRSGWHLRHRGYHALLALLIFHAGIFWMGGWTAVGVALCAQLIARAWVESFNYFQHYGLIRLSGKPIGRRHVWNHLGWCSRTFAFEITNHADHHLNSYQPYYKLVPHRESILMPSVFICFMAALIPSLWHKLIIMPALRRWDNEFADDDERVLAAAQNAAAGWPAWQTDSPSPGERSATVGT